jgi:hypothetical protein
VQFEGYVRSSPEEKEAGLPTLSPVSGTKTPHPVGVSGAWLDEGAVNPAWAPPAGSPVRQPRAAGSLVYGGVALAVVLVLVVVGSAGGFGRRTDRLRPVQPGALFRTGPFEFSFTEATAQLQRPDLNGARKWSVVVVGRARNTGDVTLAPTIFGNDTMFAIKDPGSGITAEPSLETIGDDANRLGISSRSDLTPGLPAAGYRLTFPLPTEFRPGPTVRLGVSDLVYDARYLTNKDASWHNAFFGSRIDLPLRVIPPQQ